MVYDWVYLMAAKNRQQRVICGIWNLRTHAGNQGTNMDAFQIEIIILEIVFCCQQVRSYMRIGSCAINMGT